MSRISSHFSVGLIIVCAALALFDINKQAILNSYSASGGSGSGSGSGVTPTPDPFETSWCRSHLVAGECCRHFMNYSNCPSVSSQILSACSGVPRGRLIGGTVSERVIVSPANPAYPLGYGELWTFSPDFERLNNANLDIFQNRMSICLDPAIVGGSVQTVNLSHTCTCGNYTLKTSADCFICSRDLHN